jgi:hypothetical protein
MVLVCGHDNGPSRSGHSLGGFAFDFGSGGGFAFGCGSGDVPIFDFRSGGGDVCIHHEDLVVPIPVTLEDDAGIRETGSSSSAEQKLGDACRPLEPIRLLQVHRSPVVMSARAKPLNHRRKGI